MVIDFFNALAYLQKEKVVHGDIKPENMTLTKKKDLILIDFGGAQMKGWRIQVYIHLGIVRPSTGPRKSGHANSMFGLGLFHSMKLLITLFHGRVNQKKILELLYASPT